MGRYFGVFFVNSVRAVTLPDVVYIFMVSNCFYVWCVGLVEFLKFMRENFENLFEPLKEQRYE